MVVVDVKRNKEARRNGEGTGGSQKRHSCDRCHATRVAIFILLDKNQTKVGENT